MTLTGRPAATTVVHRGLLLIENCGLRLSKSVCCENFADRTRKPTLPATAGRRCCASFYWGASVAMHYCLVFQFSAASWEPLQAAHPQYGDHSL